MIFCQLNAEKGLKKEFLLALVSLIYQLSHRRLSAITEKKKTDGQWLRRK